MHTPSKSKIIIYSLIIVFLLLLLLEGALQFIGFCYENIDYSNIDSRALGGDYHIISFDGDAPLGDAYAADNILAGNGYVYANADNGQGHITYKLRKEPGGALYLFAKYYIKGKASTLAIQYSSDGEHFSDIFVVSGLDEGNSHFKYVNLGQALPQAEDVYVRFVMSTGDEAARPWDVRLLNVEWTTDSQGTAPPLFVQKGIPWGTDFFGEYRESLVYSTHLKTFPFVEWLHKEYHGRFINVDSQGIRRTWNPTPLPDGAPLAWILGGSTCWGSGSRDDFTIPSQFSRLMHERGRLMRVVNLGERAYTNMNALLRLFQALSQGERPDYVLLYGGFNDIYAAFQAGEPVYKQNLNPLQEKLLRADRKSNVQEELRLWLLQTRTAQALSALLRLEFKAKWPYVAVQPQLTELAASFPDARLEELSRQIAEYETGILTCSTPCPRRLGSST